ncbi:MAG: branched-chain amino acid ABC transporter permease [Paracoccaceae bacterium]|jgi:branched-chain amino acid transport system permease protein|nr:branched-chain amino acid ABC transporter permease [Paracoccaceae bacterium]MDA0319212.1 branched-chain amino acid ABC transporter permease [Pseudomonadota bacterium]MDA0851290.1 branched-chain amino acid ABC transporter permease [Pseudomonadota bacterium]MDA1295078.1 branched-chain amino acid ABC transporter permease [Pseudomonadota bacterium]NCW54651.1 branched-chain amino acid ABC transporter permease [Paracoccaceae bacterium]
MDQIILQILNGLDKGSAYALIALGLTLIFGTLGVVNFAHGALFMIGAFCAVTLSRILSLSHVVLDETKKDFLGKPLKVEVPYANDWFGPELGGAIIDWAVPLSILFAIPVMILIGVIMERGLIKHFYKRPHADQILVTFGLAIVLQEIIKYYFGANQIPTPAPEAFVGSFDFGALIGLDSGKVIYPYWRILYFCFAMLLIGLVFAFLQFTTFGMVVRAGMADRETVGMLGINIDRRFTIMFGIAAAVAGLAGVMYTPINPPNYHMGMDFLVISFVVVVVGGMGSLPGAVLAGLLLGILESFASVREVIEFLPGINQVVIYLAAIVILLTRPRGLMGRKGVMED